MAVNVEEIPAGAGVARAFAARGCCEPGALGLAAHSEPTPVPVAP